VSEVANLHRRGNGKPILLCAALRARSHVTSALAIWEWFAQDVSAARTTAGTRGAVFFQGRFYDNVRIRRRGAATTNGQKFDFNRGFRLFISDELDDLDEVNLNNEASDPSFIRPPMAYESFRVAGNPASMSFNMLMRVNGGPDRVGVYVEQVDERFLERNGLDPEGALYKFIQRGALTPIFTDPNDGVEKKTRLNEDRSDLAALCAALSLTNTPPNRLAFIMDNINLPALMTHLEPTKSRARPIRLWSSAMFKSATGVITSSRSRMTSGPFSARRLRFIHSSPLRLCWRRSIKTCR
jgi:hypothetical protein